jgi:hypothetical protein
MLAPIRIGLASSRDLLHLSVAGSDRLNCTTRIDIGSCGTGSEVVVHLGVEFLSSLLLGTASVAATRGLRLRLGLLRVLGGGGLSSGSRLGLVALGRLVSLNSLRESLGGSSFGSLLSTQDDLDLSCVSTNVLRWWGSIASFATYPHGASVDLGSIEKLSSRRSSGWI